MFLIEVRLLERSLKMGAQGDGALPGPPERIKIDGSVGLYGEVTGLVAQEMEHAGGIPVEIAAELALGPGIGVETVPALVDGLVQHFVGTLQVEVLDAVAHAALQFGYDGVFLPGLQPHEDAVFQPGSAQRVHALGRIDVKDIAIEGRQGR